MLLYVDEIQNELEAISEYAKIINNKFLDESNDTTLLLDAQGLLKRMEYLASVLPESCSLTHGLRHARFLVHYLEKDDKESCSQDIRDIIESDIPNCAFEVKKWALNITYSDWELRNEIKVLIRTGQFDSAIRKSFIILKERICNKYDISREFDGVDLINQLFGKKSSHFNYMPQNEKQAHRDLFSGLFGLVRNRYAHQNVEASLTELDAVISGINYCLRLIDDFREEPQKKESN